MLKYPIKYTDFNGNERTEDFYFNLTQAELMEMELGVSGGFSEMMQRIVNATDTPAIVKVFKELILKAYGEKSDDGKRFMKTGSNGEPLSRYFAESEAYSVLFMELTTNDHKAAEFIKGIIPASLAEQIPDDPEEAIKNRK